MGIVLLLLIVVPLVEIGLFIELGGAIGTWPTIGTVIATALLGTICLRHQGLAVVGQIRSEARRGKPPVQAAIEGLMVVVAGVLLLTPGFLTDGIGFILLIPPVRAAAARAAMRRMRIVVRNPREEPPGGPTIIDAVSHDVDEPDPPDGSRWGRRDR